MPNSVFGPQTMSHRARLILEAIKEHPRNFHMSKWIAVRDMTIQNIEDFTSFRLKPGDDLCDTALCVAGWAARLDGWEMTLTDIATKGDMQMSIAWVGQNYLHLDTDEANTLFTASEGYAMAILGYMVEHNKFPNTKAQYELIESLGSR